MRTQYNAIAKSGCQPPAAVALGDAVLEGVPGTVLDEGLNDRIRAIAAKVRRSGRRSVRPVQDQP